MEGADAQTSTGWKTKRQPARRGDLELLIWRPAVTNGEKEIKDEVCVCVCVGEKITHLSDL